MSAFKSQRKDVISALVASWGSLDPDREFWGISSFDQRGLHVPLVSAVQEVEVGLSKQGRPPSPDSDAGPPAVCVQHNLERA